MIYLRIYKWILSILNILGTNVCVRNRQVFSLYRSPTLGISNLKFGLYRFYIIQGLILTSFTVHMIDSISEPLDNWQCLFTPVANCWWMKNIHNFLKNHDTVKYISWETNLLSTNVGLSRRIRIMVFNITFNNISVILW